MFCIIVKSEDGVRRVPVRDTELVVGSDPANDIVIDSPYVSGRHLRLWFRDDAVEVRDLGSLNGTRLNGRRIRFERTQAPVSFKLGENVDLEIVIMETLDLLLDDAVAPAGPERSGASHRARGTEPFDLVDSDGAAELLAVLARHGGPSPSAATEIVDVAMQILDGNAAVLLALPPADVDWRLDGAIVLASGGPLDESGLDLEKIRSQLTAGHMQGRLVPSEPVGLATVFVALENLAGVVLLVVCAAASPGASLGPLRHALALAVERPVAATPRQRSTQELTLDAPDQNLVSYRSPAMRQLHRRMAGATTSDLPVLLIGATGTGKEVYARAIHRQSHRKHGPFRAINSSAIPTELLEAMLFGAEEGAATGVRRQVGLLRDADGGTFFFDEIGEMSLQLQSKLLRVLDDRYVLPVGGTRPISVDVRFIAATNRNLEIDATEKRFREDLLYRLQGHEYVIPPLRDHIDDLALLVNAFLSDECEKVGRRIAGVTVRALQVMRAYAWPGNVRELESTVRRLVHELPDGETISHELLPPRMAITDLEEQPNGLLEARLESVRRESVLEALALAGGKRSEAARYLGLSRGGLRIIMKRLQIV